MPVSFYICIFNFKEVRQYRYKRKYVYIVIKNIFISLSKKVCNYLPVSGTCVYLGNLFIRYVKLKTQDQLQPHVMFKSRNDVGENNSKLSTQWVKDHY